MMSRQRFPRNDNTNRTVMYLHSLLVHTVSWLHNIGTDFLKIANPIIYICVCVCVCVFVVVTIAYFSHLN